jgi:hypothetical protein
MDWHGIFWLHDVVAIQELTCGGMAGDVDKGIRFMNYLSALSSEFIDNSIYRVFIARDKL